MQGESVKRKTTHKTEKCWKLVKSSVRSSTHPEWTCTYELLPREVSGSPQNDQDGILWYYNLWCHIGSDQMIRSADFQAEATRCSTVDYRQG